MRFGVLADVHANWHALDAALSFLAREDIENFLCAGDLVGYGPLPNRTADRVLSLPGHVVAGNHELIVLGELSDGQCTDSPAPACSGHAACSKATSGRASPRSRAGCRSPVAWRWPRVMG